MRKITFGTDGIRNAFGSWPITLEAFNVLGQACREWLLQQKLPLTIAISWDTRASGPQLAEAFAQGFLQDNQERIVFLGITPTPAIAYFVEHEKLSLGVSITASHNPATDNGLKLFNNKGSKLKRSEEQSIEALALNKNPLSSRSLESIKHVNGCDYYVQALKAYYRDKIYFSGQKIVLDMANGATIGTSWPLLKALGLEVIPLGAQANGQNINKNCGSEHCEAVSKKMKEVGAWLGFAHDGDGDRLVVFDEAGERLPGDVVLGMLALEKWGKNELPNQTLVVTEQSNSGLDASLNAFGIQTVRTPVGDREVYYGMLAHGAYLGGESSGHIILREEAQTGDGLRAVIACLQMALRQALTERRKSITLFPQAENALIVTEKYPLETLNNAQTFYQGQQSLNGNHLQWRYSGTENKLRFRVEGPSKKVCEHILRTWMQAAQVDFEQKGIKAHGAQH